MKTILYFCSLDGCYCLSNILGSFVFLTGYQDKELENSKMPNGATLHAVIDCMHQDRTGTYQLLMLVFAPAIRNAKYVKNEIMCGKAWSDSITISDEAFVLLAVLNGWNTWAPESLKIKDTNWPKNEACWSSAGKGSTWCKFVGWKDEGVKLYTELFDKVSQDHSDVERNKAFDVKMRELIIKTLPSTSQDKLTKANQVRDTSTIAPGNLAALDRTMENME